MAANPATDPVSTSTKSKPFPFTFAMISQVIIANARAMNVEPNALTACSSARSAPPELKPNQPNQSSPVPIAAAIRLLC